jgi:8-oxo-dGTP diphosphatase
MAASMPLPYKVSSLLYAFDPADRILLLHRRREPNRDCWSPPGGKLLTDHGESPYACAAREAQEELGLPLRAGDLHLTGIVSEHGYLGTAHWLMFLFEIKPRLAQLPPAIAEGQFGFFARGEMDSLHLPRTDRETLWPLFWRFRRGFFAAHFDCYPDGRVEWSLEESWPAPETHPCDSAHALSSGQTRVPGERSGHPT